MSLLLIASALVLLDVPAPVLRPFADYERTGILMMAAEDGHSGHEIKRLIAQHLPSGVVLVLYGPTTEARDRILEDYGRFIEPERLRYVTLPKSNKGYWSRDALPLPSLDSAGRLVLSGARYWTGFEPDESLSALLSAALVTHRQAFDGGNFAANDAGECFVVKTRQSARISDETFATHYGCRHVTRLPPAGGIGHMDERARFVSASTVLVDTPAYDAAFVARGLRVLRLPRPAGTYETYANALLVNGRAFVPQFGSPDDRAALDVYRSAGFDVVGLDARALAAKGMGSLHCLAMNYPPVAVARPPGGPHLP